jgi:peptidoglycan L-alanyl-D-glutamate endopeptidase CwlK
MNNIQIFNFGTGSRNKIASCHADLQLILFTAISISDVDFGVSEGNRSIELQKKYFDQGKSKIDGVTKKGKHNYSPSLAADIYAFVNGRASYDKETLSYLAGLLHAVAELLFMHGKITHHLRWGGNWDMDGEILLDQSFDDRPHIELIKK